MSDNNQNPMTEEDSYERTHTLEAVANLPLNTSLSIAGRIIKIRDMGSIAFANLVNFHSNVQISFNKNDLKDKKYIMNSIGNGDFVGIEGTLYKTKSDKLAVQVKKCTLLTKAQIRPHNKRGLGFSDGEKARRLRYVDYIYNPKMKKMLSTRHKIIDTIKKYLNGESFQEVETPYLQTIASGASATPFASHYNALGIPVFLRIAPELFLKRLIISGFNRVYEIGKCFRNEGIDPTHLPEFTMLEWYEAYCTHEEGQNRVVHLLQTIFKTINEGNLSNEQYDFTNIPKIEYLDFLVKCGLPRNIWDLEYKTICDIAKNKNIDHGDCKNKMAIIDRLYKKCGINNIINPILIYNYPNKPLAVQIKDRPGFSHSFQVIIAGKECVNAYMEQRNPDALMEEFKTQKDIETSGDEDFVRQDMEFVEALKYGMPPTVGVGIGIDRLVSILTNTMHIRDVISFPLNKLKSI